MTQGYENFKAQYCANLPATGYDGDFEMTIMFMYIMTLERALEQAETRADQNYSDMIKGA